MRRLCALAGAAAICLVVGCGGGKPPKPVVLEMWSVEPAGVWHYPGVDRFVQRVDQISHGRLRVDVKLATTHEPANGQRYAIPARALVRDVAAGKADLGWVDTAVFDRLGTTAFDALQAPMVIDDYSIEAAVIRSPLPARLLPAAKAAGVTGLALLAGRLRMPVDTRRPLRGPADYRGVLVRTQDSALLARAMRALGARPDQAPVPPYVTAGRVAAFEADLDSIFADLHQGAAPYVTSNVRLWPRTAVIVMNPRRLAALDSRERGWLRAAARDASAHSATTLGGDQMIAREACANGTRFAVAGRADAVALRRALRPVLVSVRRDNEAGPLLGMIEALKRATRATPSLPLPAVCTNGRPVANGARHASTTIPNGVYRVKVTPAQVRAGTVMENERAGADGTLTLTLRDGRWRLDKREPGPYTESGTYSGSPARATFYSTFAPQLTDPPDPRRLSLDFVPGGVKIAALDLKAPDEVWFAGQMWKKIG